LTKVRGNIGVAKCRCTVNGETTSEGELKFALMD
jgi:3-hydroxymyristoyl/3-hydroxydecanoyl-(acyl carrier protein) dehydratase